MKNLVKTFFIFAGIVVLKLCLIGAKTFNVKILLVKMDLIVSALIMNIRYAILKNQNNLNYGVKK